MGQLGETKHKKVLRKSKKQWVTVGLTSAALGITGLVHSTDFVSAEEAPATTAEEAPSEIEQESVETESEVADEEVSLDSLLDTYAQQAVEGANVEDVLASFTEEASSLEEVAVEDAVAQLESRLATASETPVENTEEEQTIEATEEVEDTVEEQTVETTEEVKETAENEEDTAPVEETTEVEPEVVEEAETTEDIVEEIETTDETTEIETVEVTEPEEPVVEEETTEETAQPQLRSARPQTFAAQARVATPQAQDANLDVYLGENRHVDGTPMEERTVAVELDQEPIREAIIDSIREARRYAYNDNVQFVYEDYDRPDGGSSSTNRLRTAAAEAGYHTVDEYVNAFEWSDRLEDFSIQRATELLTTGYHSGNNSHYRPDMHTNDSAGKRVQHEYRNADDTLNHSASENIHAVYNEDIHEAFEAWATEEFGALANSGGRLNYSTNAHLHSILNPMFTIYGGSSVRLANGESGARANRANVLMASKWNSANHTAASPAREGTYYIDVLTKQGGPELPGEVNPEEQEDVEVTIGFDTIERFNPELSEGARNTAQEGREGLSVNGVVITEPVDEIIEVGPVREVLSQGETVEIFDANAEVGSVVETQSGQDGYILWNTVDNVEYDRVDPQDRTVVYGPETKTVAHDTETVPNFEFDYGYEEVITEGQDGVDLYNPLTGDFVTTEVEPVTEIIEVGVEQRDVPYDTVRRPVVGLEEERTVQQGVDGVAYFDENGNEYEERSSAPQDEIVEYPAISEVIPVPEAERIAVVGIDEGVEVEEGSEGLQYFDEDGTPLDVEENVDAVAPVVHYPAIAVPVDFETEREAVVGLEEPRVAREGVEGVQYQDEDGNALGSDQDVAPINEVIEYPALAVETPFETERRAVVGLDEERIVVEGVVGLHYEDEDGNVIESDEQRAPQTQIVEYPAILEAIPFETVEEQTNDLATGERQVVTEGVDGEGYFTEEGELLEVVTEPVNEVVAVGVQTSDQDDDQEQDGNQDQNNDQDDDQSQESDQNNDQGQSDDQVQYRDEDQDSNQDSAPAQESNQETDQDKPTASINRDKAIETVTGLSNLSRTERNQVIEAIQSASNQDQVDALVAAAQDLNDVRGNDTDDTKDDAQAGERLPDTATATWALGLVGLTSLLSGLGIKKFKK